MARPTKLEHGILQAYVAAMRGTCRRRRVGCVLTDVKGRVLSTGYNGTPRSMPHCLDIPCAGASCASGTGLDLCNAVHAEQNALLQCPDVDAIHTAFVTTSPCLTCTKLLMNTGCQRIVFHTEYPHTEARVLWESVGREWLKQGGDKLALAWE